MKKLSWKAKVMLNKYAELKKQRGMSLLEIIIVLGIVGTIAAGVVVLAQRAFESQDITDLVDNTASVRTAAVQVYGDTGLYPATFETVVGLNETGFAALQGDDAPMAVTLVNMGKVSAKEIKNGLSGDYMDMAGVRLTTDAAEVKGFALALNGLDAGQCRSLLTQLANQWDYVGVTTDSGVGVGLTIAGFPASLDAATVATGAAGVGVLRSLNSNSPQVVTATAISTFCVDGQEDNTIILGSK